MKQHWQQIKNNVMEILMGILFIAMLIIAIVIVRNYLIWRKKQVNHIKNIIIKDVDTKLLTPKEEQFSQEQLGNLAWYWEVNREEYR